MTTFESALLDTVVVPRSRTLDSRDDVTVPAETVEELRSTPAPFYAIEHDDECWLILPGDVFRALVERAVTEGRADVVGDADGPGVLVPLEWFHPQNPAWFLSVHQ